MEITIDDILPLVRTVKFNAALGINQGFEGEQHAIYQRSCMLHHRSSGTRCVFTRDEGHHNSGFLKNPDYERCYHLSISFEEPSSSLMLPGYAQKPRARTFDTKLSRLWIDAFFGPWTRYIWEESAKHPGIKKVMDIRHYRVFCDAAWQPIIPRKEVYSTEFTELGWQSWSEQHDYPMPTETMRSAS